MLPLVLFTLLLCILMYFITGIISEESGDSVVKNYVVWDSLCIFKHRGQEPHYVIEVRHTKCEHSSYLWGPGGEERRNPGEEEHRYVFVLPVALAPYTFSAGFFSLGTQICFVTYVNAQCQLIYTKAIQPDGIRSPLCQGLSSGWEIGQWEKSQEGE